MKLFPFSSQTPEEKLKVLIQELNLKQDKKFNFFQKMLEPSSAFDFLKGKEKSMMDKMKATQSALQYSVKNLKKVTIGCYKETSKEIKKYTDLKLEFPEVPEEENFQIDYILSNKCDLYLLTWTPLKLLTKLKEIRDKGLATPRHSEGIIFRLLFLVASFYSIKENWDVKKLAFYFSNITPESGYQEVLESLQPLKNDIAQFNICYSLLRFGNQVSYEKGKQDSDAFEDFVQETDEDQLATLYWHHFIYEGIERFLLKYYLTLLTAVHNQQAIYLLSQIFDTALKKATEIRTLFLSSFDTDPQKLRFQKLYSLYCEKKSTSSPNYELKLKNGKFESFYYNLPLLFKNTFGIESVEEQQTPQWEEFIQQYILLPKPFKYIRSKETEEEDKVNPQEKTGNEGEEVIECSFLEPILISLMTSLIYCAEFQKTAKLKALERFKAIILSEKEYSLGQITKIKKESKQKRFDLEKKIKKFKREKQFEVAESYEGTLNKHIQDIHEQCTLIEKGTHEKIKQQKEKLLLLYNKVKKENQVDIGKSAKITLEFVNQIESSKNIKEKLIYFLIELKYESLDKFLQPFFKKAFYILEPSIHQKRSLIQTIQEAWDNEITLSLTKEEQVAYDEGLKVLIAGAKKNNSNIFSKNIIFAELLIPIGKLHLLQLEQLSLQKILSLKCTVPGKPSEKLSIETIKAVLMLNNYINPRPKNNIIFEGKEKEKIPEKAIDKSQLKYLFSKIPDEALS